MRNNVYIAFTDDGNILGCFRSHAGAIQCLKDEVRYIFDGHDENEIAEIQKWINENGEADGIGYIEDAGELGD